MLPTFRSTVNFLPVLLPDEYEHVRSETTVLVRGNYEPHRSYCHQEPEADYARCYYVIRVVHLDVQSEVLEPAKPDDQSKRHEHRYANEMFHQPSCSEASPFERILSFIRSASVYAGHATDVIFPGREPILRQL